MIWDESQDHLKFYDNTKLVFGTGAAVASFDASLVWDGTDFILTGPLDITGDFSAATVATHHFQMKPWAASAARYLAFTTDDHNTTDYLMLYDTTDGHTFVSAKNGGTLFLNGGGNSTQRIAIYDGDSTARIDATTSNFTVTGDVTAYYSDTRLKDRIKIGIDNPINKIKDIEVFTYKNNDLAKSFGFENDDIQIGVSAQSVQKVLPEVVHIAPFDLDKDGNSKSGEDYLTVKYDKIVPLLIESIKEQQKQIDELRRELEELK